MMPGVYHVPGQGMAYDPTKIRIEGDKVYINENGNWTELQTFEQPSAPNQYAQGAMSAGTLGAAPAPQWPAMQQLAMRNPLAEIIGTVNALSPQQQPKPQTQQYQNPYINNLLRFI